MGLPAKQMSLSCKILFKSYFIEIEHLKFVILSFLFHYDIFIIRHIKKQPKDFKCWVYTNSRARPVTLILHTIHMSLGAGETALQQPKLLKQPSGAFQVRGCGLAGPSRLLPCHPFPPFQEETRVLHARHLQKREVERANQVSFL